MPGLVLPLVNPSVSFLLLEYDNSTDTAIKIMLRGTVQVVTHTFLSIILAQKNANKPLLMVNAGDHWDRNISRHMLPLLFMFG